MGEIPFSVVMHNTFGVSGKTLATKNDTKNVALRIKLVPMDL
jgi:hypothetical protein